MDQELEARAERIFADAVEQAAEVRLQFVEKQCSGDAALAARVRQLLESYHRADSALESKRLLADVASGLESAGRDPLLGTHAGPYRITRFIASGGMGRVYLAEHPGNSRQRVAIKLIQLGIRTAQVERRFRNELAILARLDHPNIARLLDVGVTEDGQSFLAMEYVDGTRIDEHADAHHLGLRERLALFVTVCAAVQHAHRKLIVHRDLKPSNILINGSGQVKLLDFGIAKLLDPDEASGGNLGSRHDALTETAFRLLTPRYASPEQVRGEPVGTASDVYSLGVLLFELLTGKSPYQRADGAVRDLARSVCEQQPDLPSLVVKCRTENDGAPAAGRRVPSRPGVQSHDSSATAAGCRGTSPSGLARQLAGDLDTIVLKALRKEPVRRYASVEEFATDIRRHLAGDAVLARPDTFGYRLGKFAHRNRALVSGVVVAFLAIATGLIVSLSLYHAALKARDAELEHRSHAEWLAYQSCIAAAESSIRSNRVLDARNQLEAAPEYLRGWEWQHLASRLDRSLLSIAAHKGAITALDLGSDEATLWTASEDRTVREWDLASGSMLRSWGPFATTPRALARRRDGTLLAIGFEDGGFLLRDTATGRVLLSGRDPESETIQWRNLYQQARDTRELAEDSRLATLSIIETWPRLRFRPDGLHLAVAFPSAHVQIWDVEELRQITTWQGPSTMYSGKHPIQYTTDGRRLVLGSTFSVLQLWDIATRSVVVDFPQFTGLTDLRLSPDGRRVAAAYHDHTIRIFDTASARVVSTLQGNRASIRAIEFGSAANALVSASMDGRLLRWNIESGIAEDVLGHMTSVVSLTRSADGAHFASGDWDGTVKLWDSHTQSVRSLRIPGRDYRRFWSRAARFDSQGSRILSLGSGELLLWNVEDGKLARRIPNPWIHERSRVAWTSDDRYLLAGTSDGVCVYDAREKQPLARSFVRPGEILGVDAGPGAAEFVTCSSDSMVRIWNIERREPISILRGHRGPVLDVCCSPDGRWIASGSSDSTVRIWDAAKGTARHVLAGHRDSVRDVAFSGNGKLLASASFDGTVRLWEVATGELLKILCENSDRMYAVVFMDAENRLAAAGREGVLQVFELEGGHEVVRLHGHAGHIFALDYDEQHHALLSTSVDGTVRLWEVGQRAWQPSPKKPRTGSDASP